MSTRKTLSLILVLLVAVVLVSCAKNEPMVTELLKGHQYGFWYGIWHGMIAPFDLIGMLIWDDVTVFARHNTGFWYAFGFLLGSGGWGFLGGKSLGRK